MQLAAAETRRRLLTAAAAASVGVALLSAATLLLRRVAARRRVGGEFEGDCSGPAEACRATAVSPPTTVDATAPAALAAPSVASAPEAPSPVVGGPAEEACDSPEGAPGSVEEMTAAQREQAVELVLDRLSHLGDPCFDPEPDIIQGRGRQLHDVSRLIGQLTDAFAGKVKAKDVHRLLTGDSVQLDKLGLNDFEAQVVGGALRLRNRQMQYLTLNGNRGFGPLGARSLAAALELRGRRLASLLVADCGLGDEGAEVLADALRVNTTLQILDLRQNRLTDRSAHAFAAALPENAALESLYLNNDRWSGEEHRNSIGDDGTWALALALAETPGDVKISLVGNPVSEDTKEQVKVAVGRRIRF